MEIDFNIDNYNLEDLLNLFSLKYNFTEIDFKNSKKLVMQMHPDKSGLDKKYFLFYCKALRIIKDIHDFKNKKTQSPRNNIEYLAGNDDDKGKKHLIDNLLKKDKEFFHEWFNKTFEQINIIHEDKQSGYGEWFKSDEDLDVVENITKNKLHEKILEKKETLSSLIKINTIEASNNYNSNDYQTLGGAMPEYYSSDIFSNLQYEDLKKAHTETVVPVTTNDYNKVLKFNNANVLRQYRNQQNIKPMTETEAQDYLNELNNKTEETSVQLAYKMARQDEETEKANKTWWNSLTLLK
tara:strand:+ start:949 stop:1833 length:885 start_codon:yes stop_codon:yes gene_type:complete